MCADILIKILTGADPELALRVPALARLRISVFREFPYLYDGSLAYEEKYLATYTACHESVVALALVGDEVVGASTGLPLDAETENIKNAFTSPPYAHSEIFYCGESILLPEFRGHGLYKEFFAARENHARRLGRFKWITLCAVIRPTHHPQRPANYVPLDAIWQKFGYVEASALRCQMAWRDLDEITSSPKEMMFWLKQL